LRKRPSTGKAAATFTQTGVDIRPFLASLSPNAAGVNRRPTSGSFEVRVGPFENGADVMNGAATEIDFGSHLSQPLLTGIAMANIAVAILDTAPRGTPVDAHKLATYDCQKS
jgi:hypothetical protein